MYPVELSASISDAKTILDPDSCLYIYIYIYKRAKVVACAWQAATDYFDRGSTFCWFLAAQTIIIHRTSGSGYPIPAG